MRKSILLIVMLFTTLTLFGKTEMDLQRFKPTINLNGLIMTETADHLKPFDFGGMLYLHYDREPFLMKDSGEGVSVLENIVQGDFLFVFGLPLNFEVGLHIPISLYSSGSNPFDGGDFSKAAIGDIQLVGRYILPEVVDSLGMGFSLKMSLPTGDTQSFNGNPGVALIPQFFIDYLVMPELLFAFNIGYIVKKNEVIKNLEQNDEILFRLGAKYSITSDTSVFGEFFGSFQSASPFEKKEETPLEFLLGAKHYLVENVCLTGGGAIGISPGAGTPLFRVFGGVGYIPKATPRKTPKPRNPDVDGDGICSSWLSEKSQLDIHSSVCKDVDKCPNDPEDKDGFQDEEGCPDADNDGDGVCDSWVSEKGLAKKYSSICKSIDKCPNDSEDMDGFEDEDGCPEADNDKDGICDPLVVEKGLMKEYANVCSGIDKCPEEAEDKDGFEDEDGCPDADNDKDGICDIWVIENGVVTDYQNLCKGSDKCPNDSEDIDSFDDEDGCSDVDNDADGICDPWVSEKGLLEKYKNICQSTDQCPNESENYNGNQDDDGCPDEGKELVKINLVEQKIEITDKVFFDFNSAEISKKSYDLLKTVATSIKNNATIKKVRVEGHTDDLGKDEINLELSKNRAKAVYDFLIKEGVSKDRLIHEGYGSKKPVEEVDSFITKMKDPKTSAKDKADAKKKLSDSRDKNRRVDFIITK